MSPETSRSPESGNREHELEGLVVDEDEAIRRLTERIVALQRENAGLRHDRNRLQAWVDEKQRKVPAESLEIVSGIFVWDDEQRDFRNATFKDLEFLGFEPIKVAT